MYNIDDRMWDLDELGNRTKDREEQEVLVSMMEYLQSAQEVIDDMKECVGAGGEFIDKKLKEWIERLQ